MDNCDVQLVGGPCGQHGPYTFYKAFKYVKNGIKRIVTLSEFFFVKLWSNSDLLCIGELQLLWSDKNSDQVLASLRLYFLPENTPEGRMDHGEDEVLAISEKVVLRVEDLITWITIDAEWSWGRLAKCERDVNEPPKCIDNNKNFSGSLIESSLDFADVEKERRNSECATEHDGPLVVILSYPRYCRYRAMMRRLEGVENEYLKYKIVNALGGFTACTKNTRVLFCKDTFDYPELEGHELLCNHLAPKLKGRPRGKRKKRSVSPGSESNESESSVSNSFNSKEKITTEGGRNGLRCDNNTHLRRSARAVENSESKEFLKELSVFMKTNYTPIGKIPSLGYKELDLYAFYTKVQKLGGYDAVTSNRLWKSIFDYLSGHVNSTSAATVIRRHYERFLLPYERYFKGEEYKPLPISERRRLKSKAGSSASDAETSESTSRSGNSTPIPHTSSVSPPILTTPTENKEFDMKNDAKSSSLRSVRVKTERQKDPNNISDKLDDNIPINNNNNIDNEMISSPETLLNDDEPQLNQNMPEITETDPPPSLQLEIPHLFGATTPPPPPSSPPILLKLETSAINSAINADKNAEPLTSAVAPIAQKLPETPQLHAMLPTVDGKENIPLIKTGATPTSPDVVEVPYKPKTPEIIDLDADHYTNIKPPPYLHEVKKRKLDILKEGGLEVTPVRHAYAKDMRPSVIQPTPSPPKSDFMPPPTIPRKRTTSSSSSTATSMATTPPKVLQSKSIYSYSERTVYGDPKNIIMTPPPSAHAPKFKQQQQQRHLGGDILDLTVTSPQKPAAVEIVKLPPSPHFGARAPPPVIDGRRLGANIEITLVEQHSRPRVPPPPTSAPPPAPPPRYSYPLPSYQMPAQSSRYYAPALCPPKRQGPPPMGPTGEHQPYKISRIEEKQRASSGKYHKGAGSSGGVRNGGVAPVGVNHWHHQRSAMAKAADAVAVPKHHYGMGAPPPTTPLAPYLGHLGGYPDAKAFMAPMGAWDPIYTAAVQSLYAHSTMGGAPLAPHPAPPAYSFPSNDQLKIYSEWVAHNSRMNFSFPVEGAGHHPSVNSNFVKKL